MSVKLFLVLIADEVEDVADGERLTILSPVVVPASSSLSAREIGEEVAELLGCVVESVRGLDCPYGLDSGD